MFNSLTGRISGQSGSTVFLQIGGIEWEIETSGYSLSRLASREEATMYTHLHHREDAMRLYGFESREERTVFLQLLTVSGVGPRQALKLLSASSPSGLTQMLEAEDVDGLTRLPGLGKKTASKLILALRGTLVHEESAPGGHRSEIVAGLVEMGFDPQRASEAVQAADNELRSSGQPAADPAATEREVFRRAIVALSDLSS